MKFRHSATLAFLLGTSLCAGMAAFQVKALDQHAYFQAADIFDLEYGAEPQVSPDGRSVLYVRNSHDVMKDTTRSTLWLIDLSTGQQSPLFVDQFNYSMPRWSPDGRQIAFVSDRTGSRQIHLHWLKENRTALLSALPKSPSQLTWSPDGQYLAFSMNVAAAAPKLAQLTKMPKKPAGAQWADPVVVIDRAQYQADGQGFLKPEFRQIFLLPASGGTARQLTSGERQHGADLNFTPDGKHLVFSANLDADWEYQPRDKDLYQLSLQSGQIKALTRMAGQEEAATFSPDGRQLAFIWSSNAKVPFTNGKLKILDVQSGQINSIAPDLDLDLSNPQWLNSQELVVQYDQRGLRKLAKIDLKGKMTELTSALSGTTLPQPYLSGSYHVSKQVIAYTHGTATRPADIAVLERGKTRVLTALNEDLLGHKKMAQVHEINYKSSFDGEPIQGWYLTPPDFDPNKKYPLILEIHGGPHLAYGPHFSAEMQRYAAAGYVVFYDNHRGSTSYGERFAMLLDGKYSSKEDYADHDAGVDAMLALGFVDANNLFIAGGSAGGIATAYAIGLTDRYKAAAVIKPIINWLSKVLTGDTYLYQTFHQFPGVPWEHVDHYWQRSPLSLVGNVKTPTLLMTGEEDRRTPISESEQFYQALKIRKIDTALVRVPGAPHGISNRPSRMIAKIETMLAWFGMYQTTATPSKGAAAN